MEICAQLPLIQPRLASFPLDTPEATRRRARPMQTLQEGVQMPLGSLGKRRYRVIEAVIRKRERDEIRQDRPARNLVQTVQHTPTRPKRKPLADSAAPPLKGKELLLVPLHCRRPCKRDPKKAPPISVEQTRILTRVIVLSAAMRYYRFNHAISLDGTAETHLLC